MIFCFRCGFLLCLFLIRFKLRPDRGLLFRLALAALLIGFDRVSQVNKGNRFSRLNLANGDDNGNEIGDDDSEMMKVLGLLEENASITAKQMSEQMDISARKVSRLIKALKENGKIIRVGSDRKGYWKITQ